MSIEDSVIFVASLFYLAAFVFDFITKDKYRLGQYLNPYYTGVALAVFIIKFA